MRTCSHRWPGCARLSASTFGVSAGLGWLPPLCCAVALPGGHVGPVTWGDTVTPW